MVLLLHTTQLVVAGAVPHCVAILCTIFRLGYRVRTNRFWWEDVWAAFALISDVFCLASIWIAYGPFESWILVITFTSVLWAARMSVIVSIIRITKHSVSNSHKQITYAIAISFVCMWTAVLAQKSSICTYHACQMDDSVALSQLITDLIADVSLLIVPLHLWKNVGLSRGKKILVLSTFGSSLLITAVTIPHSVAIILSGISRRSTLIVAHIKTALSLIICNLLVIVTFAYRVRSKGTFDIEQSFESNEVLTSAIVLPGSNSTTAGRSVSLKERTTSREITTVQAGVTTKLEIEDTNMHYIEDDTSTKECP